MKFGDQRNNSKRMTWIPDPPKSPIASDMGCLDIPILHNMPLFFAPLITHR